MKLYKLEDNRLISPPNFYSWVDENGILNTESPVSTERLKIIGYKYLTTAPHGGCKWYEVEVCNYTEDETHIFENWSVEAQSNLQQSYIERLATELERALFNDFQWAGKVVKLSESNQKDYLAAYTLATLQPTLYIPFNYTFKDNAKYVMSTIEEITDFTNQSAFFVSVTLVLRIRTLQL
jgi:hypothetical protein